MRTAEKTRKTNETAIFISCNLDDSSDTSINTGIGFFDHMLDLFAKHGRIGLNVKADGDLHIDGHHTVEDVGIVLGQVIKEALGDKKSITRYGTAYVPMDESLGFVAIDISGRPFLHFEAEFTNSKLGDFDTELVKEFLTALAFQSGITLHARVLYGDNTHHKIESLFKALGRAFSQAIQIDPMITGVNSTKGFIE
ncbi:imidazoleglycerol-phosphate dehydratase HisB [Heyndrickxia sporothermodurans]|uniref:Imidazoleglycerol-phosphate dehydratase n=1 Tax=Heyndrickxia sporothermodurans TaxID=46224 RepID=A0A150L8W5_9BACI|nr:imidazoleglycerol-phosphate dehydratase HisB [Heyndrickxia sporothermodurans]KYD08469.1 Imidazoleglycerol-phosphate dehydratase [Heyndrickxia sporothermodurans]MBL5767396.1 imidazoleglycerol-phosphate dehydratase HisB [Heyndrickxia sporothermodurans]MBL5770746.1 imidazoleglycerol-phosphate dehydratase HisB [Heyndrickxia sporothermodurans]MBL5774508.1 imidazoleglycerol-phosphate dehydratase HisB [Heyndrickxia sporothermodurans]MBL5777869.1 imidazoleglycerol-phosphate dehydratase HisB [Heyndr